MTDECPQNKGRPFPLLSLEHGLPHWENRLRALEYEPCSNLFQRLLANHHGCNVERESEDADPEDGTYLRPQNLYTMRLIIVHQSRRQGRRRSSLPGHSLS